MPPLIFSSTPLFLLALSFTPFLFLRLCDFGANRVQETCLLTPFHSNDGTFFLVGLKKLATHKMEGLAFRDVYRGRVVWGVYVATFLRVESQTEVSIFLF